MNSVEILGPIFAFLGLFGAGLFFWTEKKIAGFAFLVVFIMALASASHQRVVLSSFIVGLTVERSAHSGDISRRPNVNE